LDIEINQRKLGFGNEKKVCGGETQEGIQRNPAGKKGLGDYVLSKYQDMKAVVKEKGVKGESPITGEDRYYVEDAIALGEGQRILYGSAVDDNPKTKDTVKIEYENVPSSSPLMESDYVRETFTEKMIGSRLAITYDYLARIATGGHVGEANLSETFDAKTGEKIEVKK